MLLCLVNWRVWGKTCYILFISGKMGHFVLLKPLWYIHTPLSTRVGIAFCSQSSDIYQMLVIILVRLYLRSLSQLKLPFIASHCYPLTVSQRYQGITQSKPLTNTSWAAMFSLVLLSYSNCRLSAVSILNTVYPIVSVCQHCCITVLLWETLYTSPYGHGATNGAYMEKARRVLDFYTNTPVYIHTLHKNIKDGRQFQKHLLCIRSHIEHRSIIIHSRARMQTHTHTHTLTKQRNVYSFWHT